MKQSPSIFTDAPAWHVSAQWAKKHQIVEQAVEVTGNEYYTEYAIHYVVRHHTDERTQLPPEIEAEAHQALSKREEDLKKLNTP